MTSGTMRWLVEATLVTALAIAAGPAAAGAEEGGADDREHECPAVPAKGMEGYVLKVAWAEGRTEAQALEAARISARSQLVDQLCQGYDELHRAAVRRHVRDWEEGYWEPPRRGRQGSACAAVTIEGRFLDLVRHEYEAFDRDLTGLADRLRENLGDAPLVLEPPRWASSGCNAADLGAAISGELRTRLPGLRIAAAGKRPRGAQVLRLTLTPGADAATLDAGLRPLGADVETNLGGLRFSPGLFAIAADEVGECAGEPTTGVAERAGNGGLSVEVLFGAPDGLACDGSQVPMGLFTDQPAQAWMFSVAPDGAAYLIWPTAPDANQVDGQLSLGTADIVRYPGGGDELLLAAALPPDQTWIPVSDWQGPCRVSEGIGALGWPPSAAAGTASYTIVPAGQGDCPHQTTIDPGELAAALARLPECGG